MDETPSSIMFIQDGLKRNIEGLGRSTIFIMITLLAVGKVKEPFLKEGLQEYLTRIRKYTKIEYREVDMLTIPDGYVTALDEHGKEYTSTDFAQYLKPKLLEQKNLVFLIGGAEGIPKNILAQCHDIIALSKMTFPNQMVRMIFAEQIYRALTILHGEPYHK